MSSSSATSGPALGTLSHWTLLVSDLGRSLAFYEEVMGWRPVGEAAGGACRMVRDGQRIELVARAGVGRSALRPAVNHAGLSHLTVATDPAPSVIGALEKHSVKVRRHTLENFVPGPAEPSQFLFEDPDGNLVETFAAPGEDWSPFGEVGGSDPEPTACGIRHLSHWSLCVRDPERSLPFYRDVLGWRELAVMEWEGEGPSRVMDVGPARLTTWLLAAGDQRVEIIHFAQPPVLERPGAGSTSPGLSHLTIEVGDLDGAAERLGARGLEGRWASGPAGRCLVTSDPDGLSLCWVESAPAWPPA